MENDKNIPSIALILANIIPLIGVLIFAWKISNIMFFYWAENGIIGFYNILKIRKAEGKLEDYAVLKVNGVIVEATKLRITFFFIVHYGFFMLIHGILIATLFGLPGLQIGFFLSLLSLITSHGISYKMNFLEKEEFKNISLFKQMMAPYSRIIAMQITIIFGGLLTTILGIPTFTLLILIFVKICLDLQSHGKEHSFFKLKAFKDLSKIQKGEYRLTYRS